MAASGYLLTVDDSSPQIIYSPAVDPYGNHTSLSGWDAVYTGSETPEEPGKSGKGETFHVTSLDGAQVSVQWTGTGIRLLGNATQATYDVLLDERSTSDFNPSPLNGTLVDIDNLPQGHHTITLVAHTANASGSSIAFNATILKSNVPTWSTSVMVNPVDDRALAFSGHWSYIEDLDPTGQIVSLHETETKGDFAALQFNGSGIAVMGFRNITSGLYNVTLDGALTVFDGKSFWAQPTTLFYQTGLDPTTPHELTITNAEAQNLSISHVTLITVAGTPPKHVDGLQGGPLIGTVVGSILGTLFLLALLLFGLRRWRSRPVTHDRFSSLVRCRQRQSRCLPLWRREADAESWDGHSITFAPAEKAPQLPVGQDVLPMEYPRPPREYAFGRRGSADAVDVVLDIAPQEPEEAVSMHGLRRGSRSALLDGNTDAHPYLTFPRASPFAVNFDGRPPRSTAEVPTSTAPPPAAAISHTRAAVHSFLDFASSVSSASRRTQASRQARHSHTGSGSSSSARSALPIPFRAGSHSRRGSGSSPSFPYPMQSQGPNGSGSGSGADGEPPSPGHSIPLTVSDIHFRPLDEFSDSEGARTRPVSSTVRAGHPPLSAHSFGSPASPIILQRLRGLGGSAAAPGQPPRPWTLSPPPAHANVHRRSMPAGPRSLPKPPQR